MEMGLSMLAIGMITVFFILFFVVAAGNILIRVINRFFAIDLNIPAKTDSSSDVKNKMAAIIAAVDVATAGKGNVTSIKKLNS